MGLGFHEERDMSRISMVHCGVWSRTRVVLGYSEEIADVFFRVFKLCVIHLTIWLEEFS